jgi:HlyD family secretion protein
MTMTKKTMIGLGVVVLAVAAVLLVRGRGNGETGTYRFVTISRGDVESTVSATGALNAVSTVQVGTQVSGQVAEIHADFNSQVKKGQLLARIDPTLQEQAVKDAQASLDRARADLAQKQYNFDQTKDLWSQKLVTETEYRTAEYNLAMSKSSLTSAETGLERAQRNLAYTKIYAPIDGTVIERNVDVGQTVAASLSAPQLFLIAEDLSRMQILVSVDESDIGEIHEGQEVRFTVQAYPDEHFSGVVKQVRLQSTSQENVVNYTVVVEVSNPEKKLLPGMTATVEFILAQAKDVLMVPNAALRFRATTAMQAEVQSAVQQGASDRGTAPTDSARAAGGAQAAASGRGQGARGAGRGQAAGSAQSGGFAQLWYLDDSGALRVTRARTGLTDGQVTEITAPELKDGMEVIAAVTDGGSAAPAASNANPFEPQQGGRGGPGRGF